MQSVIYITVDRYSI